MKPDTLTLNAQFKGGLVTCYVYNALKLVMVLAIITKRKREKPIVFTRKSGQCWRSVLLCYPSSFTMFSTSIIRAQTAVRKLFK